MQVIAPRPEFEAAAARFAALRGPPCQHRPGIRAQGAVPARGPAQRAGRPAASGAARAPPRILDLSDTIVLCYHAVSERWPAPLSVTPQAFERQLELLVRRGYEGATFRDAVLGAHAGKTVVVTFDDAYLSVLELARPILDRLGLPGDGVRAHRLGGARTSRCGGRASTSGWAARSSPSCARCRGSSSGSSTRTDGRSGPTPGPIRTSPPWTTQPWMRSCANRARSASAAWGGRARRWPIPTATTTPAWRPPPGGPATRRRARCPRGCTPRGRWNGPGWASTTTTPSAATG